VEFKKIKNRTFTFYTYIRRGRNANMENPFGAVMSMNRNQRHFLDLKNFLDVVCEPQKKLIKPLPKKAKVILPHPSDVMRRSMSHGNLMRLRHKR